jgi:peptidoglycan/LPS O-acetylase OafA/YrhL
MRYRAEIDGLRTLAVIPVILFHAGFHVLGGGFVGVDIFFVISGYLITGILLAELNAGRFSILNFYERRARRILPALFLVLLVSVPCAWYVLLPHDFKGFASSLAAVSIFGSNILFWGESGYFDSAAELKPLLHTWSLVLHLLPAIAGCAVSMVPSSVGLGFIGDVLAQPGAGSMDRGAHAQCGVLPAATTDVGVAGGGTGGRSRGQARGGTHALVGEAGA